MTLTRQDVRDIVAEMFAFGTISASKLDSTNTLEATIDGAAGDKSATDHEVMGQAPLQYRPVAGTECLYVQLSDERVCFATRDKRFGIECGAGEVVLRDLASGTAYLKLSPTGSVALLKGVTVTLDPTTRTNLAGAASTQPFVNGTALFTYLDAMFNAIIAGFNGITAGAPTGGTGAGTAITAAKVIADALPKTAALSTIIRGR